MDNITDIIKQNAPFQPPQEAKPVKYVPVNSPLAKAHTPAEKPNPFADTDRVHKRVMSILGNPNFKKLSEEQQAELKTKIYEKLIKHWAQATGREKYLTEANQSGGGLLTKGFESGLAEFANVAAATTNWLEKKTGIKTWTGASDSRPTMTGHAAHSLELDSMFLGGDYNEAIHGRTLNWRESAQEMAGNLVGSAPTFAVGEGEYQVGAKIAKAVGGGKVLKLGSGILGKAGAKILTKGQLAYLGPVAKVLDHSLHGAIDGVLYGINTDQDPVKQAEYFAVGAGVGSVAIGAAAKVGGAVWGKLMGLIGAKGVQELSEKAFEDIHTNVHPLTLAPKPSLLVGILGRSIRKPNSNSLTRR